MSDPESHAVKQPRHYTGEGGGESPEAQTIDSGTETLENLTSRSEAFDTAERGWYRKTVLPAVCGGYSGRHDGDMHTAINFHDTT